MSSFNTCSNISSCKLYLKTVLPGVLLGITNRLGQKLSKFYWFTENVNFLRIYTLYWGSKHVCLSGVVRYSKLNQPTSTTSLKLWSTGSVSSFEIVCLKIIHFLLLEL